MSTYRKFPCDTDRDYRTGELEVLWRVQRRGFLGLWIDASTLLSESEADVLLAALERVGEKVVKLKEVQP